ncbi:hypothetical protein N0V90_000096 [Kalmusia sp. IMI 367209]|nr:hypothetical protein N0V90_000096 [Kalmusia sp. IMI 367209]
MTINLQTPIVAGKERTSGRQKAQDESGSDTVKPTEVFKKYFGGIWVKVINKTQFNLSYVPGDLDYGEMINGPPDADAWTTKGFGVGGNTWLGMGVRPKGGVQMRLKLDNNNNFDFTLALSSAMFGNYNASLVKGHDRSGAVKALKTAGASISSDWYQGVTKGDIKHGTSQFNINVVTSPGYEMSLVISQDE